VSFETEVTQLDNGLRVASQTRPGRYCTIGVAIKAGSRFESGFPKGVSHVAEKLGFLSTRNFPEKDSVIKEMERYGAICDSQTSRDTTVYAISTQVNGLEKMMKLLGDALYSPLITEDELNNVRQTIVYETEDMQLRPDKEAVIIEMIHEAAWQKNTLGFSRYCNPDNVNNITRTDLLKYMKSNYVPERMVVSGVGINHKELVDLTKEYITSKNATWNMEGVSSETTEEIPAKYTGGESRVQQDFAQFNAGPLPVPKLAHMALGLESVSHLDPHFIPACVLNIMMGGGGSFSAGGPGKGMYSRLYTNVLNLKHWVYNATAYNNSYGDSGLFCIYGSAPPEYMKHLTEVLVQELYKMADPLDGEEFERAKRQLQSMLMMNLESRPVLFEDIGRQILAHGHYKPPTEYMRLIENVTENDIQALAKRMLQKKPCMAALGTLDRLPEFSEIISVGDNGEYLKAPSKGFFRR